MKVDAHQHYWTLTRDDYTWLSKEMEILYRDYLPADLSEHLSCLGISCTVAVQAAPTVDETAYLLQLADTNSTIAGVVGWLDLEAPEFPSAFKRLRQHPKFVGLRPMLQDLPDDRWILRDPVVRHLKLLAKTDFPLDLLIYPRHIPHVLSLFERVPNLRVVIDHSAKPNITEREIEPWRSYIRQLADIPTVLCKLSGMVTEADHAHWTVDDLRPYVEHVIECFGAERLMFGSDWPVCLLAANYRQVHDALMELVLPLVTEAHLHRVFGDNAVAFYRLAETAKSSP